MSENEKKLRNWFTAHEARGLLTGVPLGLLDALLAEHRAEVESLKNTIRAAHTEIAAFQAQLSGASEAIHTARDAALEEAKGVAERCVTLGFEATDVAEHLEGLKAQPARQYVDVEKVREVLTLPSGHPLAAFCTERLRLLGLSLNEDAQS